MRTRTAVFLVLALALACATLLAASYFTGALLEGMRSLPAREARLVQPLLALATALLIALGVFLRRRDPDRR
jgi:hypothetical protein